MDNNNIHPLNTSWILWYHQPDDMNWDTNSYKEVCKISSIEDFWLIYNNIKSSQIENGMFFLMRENVFPRWEDSKNKNGGCWSFKVEKKKVYSIWLDLCICITGEKIMSNIDDTTYINGVSISPKKGFSIIKIWISDKNKNKKSLLSRDIDFLDVDSCIYKNHR